MPSVVPPAEKNASSIKDVPEDLNIPDNYVQHTLETQKPRPPFQWSNWRKEFNWLHVSILCTTPIIGLVGACFTPLRRETLIFSILWYFVTGLGITAGYHRLWAHRSYNASVPLQYYLAFAGAGAVEGSIKWWARGHRAHHRYTDTDLDPYNAHQGFWFSHIGWMLLKPRHKLGVADISDLSKNPVVRWQHRHYLQLVILMSFVLPTVIPWVLWGDARGGYIYAGILRLVFVHHVRHIVSISFGFTPHYDYSLLSASIRSLTGSERLPLMTSIHQGTTLPLPS